MLPDERDTHVEERTRDGGPPILSLLLVRFEAVPRDYLSALSDDPRFEVVKISVLSPRWAAFAQRVSGVVVASTNDPFGALLYALSAGVESPIIVAAARYRKDTRSQLMAAGARHCLDVPISRDAIDCVIPLLSKGSFLTRVDRLLRFVLDPIACRVLFRSRSVQLTQTEFAILDTLSRRSGQMVAAEDVLRYVRMDRVRDGSKRLLDVHICNLRKKLSRIGLPGALATARGYGYSLVRS